MLRHRKAKIVATLGPSSQTFDQILDLHEAGADVFRLNFSHGNHAQHRQTYEIIRSIEQKVKSPIAILADLQGPKLRIGQFTDGSIILSEGDRFILDTHDALGDSTRVYLPHPQLFQAIQTGIELLLDDGKIRLLVETISDHQIITRVITGGKLSNRKGVNVPGVTIPISAITEKDRHDLEFALDLGVDWVAISFVQRPEDVLEARDLIENRAKLVSKIEKPKAMEHLIDIIGLSDGVMVARGDLGVEMAPEEVPTAQKTIIRECREAGKPVIVATQMLDSMIQNPSPTRAEASDVATAIYDGVDAVMLSAESASGDFPKESVSMMNRIIRQVEQDPFYLNLVQVYRPSIRATIYDAMTSAARQVAQTIPIKAIVTFTETGNSTLREARERPKSAVVALTPNERTARMMNLYWGTLPIMCEPISSLAEMVRKASDKLVSNQVAQKGDHVIVLAGVPFGQQSGTNIMRILEIDSDYKDR
ncbi:MAG: pyruvate kinase [Candidatus Paracaedibacteraceae bacterium]|nr:pyruvate kinase [Candidatus Paracaedibacteraceae bacterium]